MARPGAFEHLKSEILKAYNEGAKPLDVLKKYPDLPRMNAYRWYRLRFGTTSETDSESDAEGQHPPSLVALDGKQQQSDIALARTALRRIVKGGDGIPPAVVVQAAVALMKLAHLRHELPKHIIDETEVGDLQAARDRIRDLPPEELARRYREALG